jgi:hypothetical protein
LRALSRFRRRDKSFSIEVNSWHLGPRVIPKL